MIVEICANSFASAQAAKNAGAARIELCTELSVGGLTPSYGLIEKVVSEINIPIHVLIRPRSGDFCYSEAELDVMLKDIAFCKQIGCSGIVSGILTSERSINESATKLLIAKGEAIEFTFHRAFDWCINPLKEIHSLTRIGVTRLLSSGQQPQAIDGIELLKKLKEVSEECIEIMPGGGINSQNVHHFKKANFSSVHLSATIRKQLLNQPPKVAMHSLSFFEEGIIATSSQKIIKEIIALIS